MSDLQLKSKGQGIQFIGLLILLAGTRGFFIFQGDLNFLYFPGLIVSVIIFAICLSRGGALIQKSKE